MNVESSKEVQANGEFPSVREAVGTDAEITSIDTLTTEIDTVIDDTNSLQQQDYVVGEVADYGTSGNGNVHFKLVHRKEERENRKDDRLHCIIYENRRPNITVNVREGQRVAVRGNVTFYAPRSRCSIEVKDVVPADGDDSSHPFERLRTDRRIQLALATVLLLVILAVVSLLVL